jgi:hypothetical protein
MRSAPTDDVVSVSFREHAGGAVTGAISGVFVGVVAGAALGAITYRSPDRNTNEALPCLLAACSRSEGAVLRMRTGGLLGLLGGDLSLGFPREPRHVPSATGQLGGSSAEMMKTDPAGSSVVMPRGSPSIRGVPASEWRCRVWISRRGTSPPGPVEDHDQNDSYHEAQVPVRCGGVVSRPDARGDER